MFTLAQSLFLQLFKSSLKYSYYPGSFQIAPITMSHNTDKSKNKTLPYQPLSLTSCITVKLNNIFTELLSPIHSVPPSSPLRLILFIICL